MNPVMDRLREGTAELHERAEHQDFQQRMARAALDRDEYAAWLGQMLSIHRALEAALARRADDRRFAAVAAEHAKVEHLEADLAALGAPPPAPLPATARLLEKIAAAERDAPLRLLGHHYVLEGSMNGNRILAKRLLPALGLEPARGGRYLDPYGDRQRAVWSKFKDDMAAVGFSPAEIETLLAGAREMFAAIADVSADLSTELSEARAARR